jgi:tripartite-type tricarboxylate transporter receptor subunit TctC
MLSALCVAALSVIAAPAATAQEYPAKPITLIVPFPAGGGVDVIGRIGADKLAASLGQPVVIDNRGGADGVIGTRVAARAAPDGYTLVMATSGTIAINPNLYVNPGYHTLKDLSPIGLISSTPIVLMAHPSAPDKSLADVIAAAKREPGKLNIGTPPPGTSAFLGGELFKSLAGIDVTIVTYRGTGPLTTDLIGGHVKLALNVLAPAMSMLKAGSLKALAVLAPKRSSHLPDVPTSAEAGLPGFESGLNYGLLAPAGTPRPIIEKLNRALRAGVDTPEVRMRIATDGGDPMPSSPEEYVKDIEREDARWGSLIRKLNLKVE